MPPRKTKTENGTSTDVLTRKSRKMVSARIVEETNAGLVDEDPNVGSQEDGGAQDKSAPRIKRKNLQKRRGGKGKVMRTDSIELLTERYKKVLKDAFSEMNTDRAFDTFDVDCEITVPTPGHVMISARLMKSDYFIYAVSRYSVSYPGTIMEVACDLYDFMVVEGREVALILGA